MKNVKLIATLLFACQFAIAQTNVFHENMETVDSLFSSGNPGWFQNSRLQVSGSFSDSTNVTTGGTSVLETSVIDFTGYTVGLLQFKHICKISFFDSATVEVFNGTSWIKLTSVYMMPGQIDSGAFAGQGNKFTEGVYPDWLPGQNVSPDNNWWKTENFDISPIVSNITNAKIRWTVYDTGLPGGDGRAGWFLDDISVVGAPCELIPPAMLQLSPVIQNHILSLGPYTLNLFVNDASGIDTANVLMVYAINGGLPDTVFMNYTTGSIFSGVIPAVADSDTVCYYFVATDLSACSNTSLFPASGCTQFIASSGLTIPFCDDFDLVNFWTDSILSGSHWQYGTPSGSPALPHSPPNVWEVALGTQYLNSTESYLYSPPLSFLNITNATLDLWFNSDCENTWDGTRVDYSINNGATWNVLGGLGTGTNWYNAAILNSSGLPGWTGTASQWTNATHSLAVLNNQPNCLLRFVFTSDASVTGDGFAVDDVCITVPIAFDAAMNSIIQPVVSGVVGQCVPVVFSFTNNGMQPITNITFTYNDGMGQSATVTQTLNVAPGATVTDTILPCYTIPAGAYHLCVYVSLLNDAIAANDTVCISGFGVPTISVSNTVSYCDSFDSTNIGWASQLLPPGVATSNWELGTPAFGLTNSPHTVPNAWDINVSSAYTNFASVALVSPRFSLSANANSKISFWQNRNTENLWDGVRLEYTVNNGVTWQSIGVLNDTAGTNWYNGTVSCFLNQPGWTGNSLGWQYSEFRNLNFLNGQTVQLRFTFCSDGVVTADGFSIDDFCIGQNTLQTVDINTTGLQLGNVVLGSNRPNPFSNQTAFDFSIPETGDVKISIADLSGRVIFSPVNKKLETGTYTITIGTKQLNSGVYFYTIYYKDISITKKMMVIGK